MQEVRWKRQPRSIRILPEADVARDEILRIREKHGVATAEVVVEESADEVAPLHRSFTWDDQAAAHQHRLHQAREIMNSIEVVLLQEDPKGEAGNAAAAPAFIVVEQSKGYEPVEVVMSSPEMREKVLQRAWTDLLSWQRRYSHLQEFSQMFALIKQGVVDARHG